MEMASGVLYNGMFCHGQAAGNTYNASVLETTSVAKAARHMNLAAVVTRRHTRATRQLRPPRLSPRHVHLHFTLFITCIRDRYAYVHAIRTAYDSDQITFHKACIVKA